MRPIVLIGGGGHCKSVIEAANGTGKILRGILDRPELVGSSLLTVPYIGSDGDIATLAGECDFIITVGSITSAATRLRLYQTVKASKGRFATITAVTAHVSEYARIGEGTVILHGACINASADIGCNAIINTLACIEHDVTIGAHTHISTAAVVNGNSVIGEASFVGSRAVVNNNVTVASHVIIGSGAVVCKDITTAGTYVGIPAKQVR